MVFAMFLFLAPSGTQNEGTRDPKQNLTADNFYFRNATIKPLRYSDRYESFLNFVFSGSNDQTTRTWSK